ncbi:hypothetical protein GBA65_14890 [Rubrobacter marinus]|uniref:Uncharacterized protein n=1 Tax=Rubrobacter marinus TaxID=2653852 RepID=A0A6G8PZE9_9ACTN|nr:hypothetical protein [Rubrobacter marinus]QIN79593.1 hypothetical protein GBA65_14890 [Rubrobacter marinus]
MRTELVVRAGKQEAQEAVARFFEGRKDLYHGVRGPLRLTDYRAVEAKVNVKHARFAGWRAAAGVVAGLVALPTMETVTGDPSIEVVAKSTEPGIVRLRISTKDGVKPEAVEPLLGWLRDELGATEPL